MNPAFERLTGYARDEVLGKSARLLRSGKHDAAFYANLWRAISRGDTWHGHFINRRKDGSLFEEDAAISCVRNDAGEIINYVAIKHDVTHETNLERQLRLAQRMESMGALAGHIAHDFNNILALILGHCEIAERNLTENDPIRFSLQHIAKAGNRAKDLVRQILTFSRQIEHERKPVEIHGIVKEALEFLRVSLPPTVELHSDIREDCGYVLADPTAIHQIVMNLCTNAFQAMNGQKGALDVQLGLEHIPADFIADVGAPAEGMYVCLTVRDAGLGMDPDTIQHIFEPFFTTKKLGEGTGLGLSVIHGIVLSYDGTISVQSEPGTGTTFKVFFPWLESGVAVAESLGEPALKGDERILLVEDDSDLAQVTQAALGQLGYHVEMFSHAAHARDVFRDRPKDFSMVITDQVMPDMTGLELARELTAIRPGVPVILITGFGNGVTPSQAKTAGITEYMMKPASAGALSAAIRRCLDQRA